MRLFRMPPDDIARWLYTINIPLSLLAIVIIVYINVFNFSDAIGAWRGTVVLLVGLFAQYLYGKQRNYAKYMYSRIAWLYSVILNMLWIAADISYQTDSQFSLSAIVLMLYPLFFLLMSCIALFNIKPSIAQAENQLHS